MGGLGKGKLAYHLKQLCKEVSTLEGRYLLRRLVAYSSGGRCSRVSRNSGFCDPQSWMRSLAQSLAGFCNFRQFSRPLQASISSSEKKEDANNSTNLVTLFGLHDIICITQYLAPCKSSIKVDSVSCLYLETHEKNWRQKIRREHLKIRFFCSTL